MWIYYFIYINPSVLNRKSTVDPCLVTTTGASRVAELNSTVVPVNKKRKVLWHQAIHKKIVRVSFCKKRTISWQKVIKQCKLSSVLARSCSNERKKSNQNVKQTWKVLHFPWGMGLGGWWFYEKKTSLRKVFRKKLFKVTCRSQQVGCNGWWGWCKPHPLCFPLESHEHWFTLLWAQYKKVLSQCQFNLCMK